MQENVRDLYDILEHGGSGADSVAFFGICAPQHGSFMIFSERPALDKLALSLFFVKIWSE